MVKPYFWFVMILVSCVTGTVTAQEYAHSLTADDMTIAWQVDGDLIHMQLSAPTEGWVGVGFDPEDDMLGADIIIGAVKNGKVRIEDHYGDRKRGHSQDSKLGGENDVLSPGGKEENGVTTISFTRALAGKDSYDKTIEVSKNYRIMMAYGSGRDSFRAGHAYRSIYEVNFATGDAKKIK